MKDDEGPSSSPRLRSSKNKMPEDDAAEVQGAEPGPSITFPWGSWICVKCNGVNVPNSRVCGHVYGSSPCVGSFWEATEWAPYAEPAAPGGTREESREEKRRVKVRALDLALKHGTWMCRRCGVENIKNRTKCYKCSTMRLRLRGHDDSESSDNSEHERRIADSINELMGSFGRPKTRKRGGVRHKKSASTPKKKAKKKKVCRCGRNHKAVRPRHRVPAGQLCLKGFKSWLIARKVRNRLAHTKNGNTAYWGVARLSVLLGLVPLVPLVYHTEQELEQTVSVVLESAATATGEVLDEFGSSARQVVRVLFKSILFVFLVILWAVTRTCRNRLMHALVGNMQCKLIELSKGESTWEVRKYRVWLGDASKACSCRAYLNEGTCGHIDAAVEAARQQGIIETKVRFTPTARDRGLAALGSPLAQRSAAGGASCLPFDAIAKKARDLVSTKKEEKKKEEVGCFEGLTSKRGSKKEPSPPVETLAIEDAPAVTVDAEKDGKNSGVEELIYLDGKVALDRAVSMLNESDRTSEIFVRAYSFDQPDVVQSVRDALTRGAKVWVITDGSQARGSTKLQLQAVKMIREAGALVRLCCGGSVNAAYDEDKRDVRVGGKLRGLHRHSKTILVRYFHDSRRTPSRTALPSTRCLIGSCNFTTSSKANAESGVFLRLSRGSNFEKDWIHAFEA